MDYAGVLTDGPGVLGLVRRGRGAGVATALVSDGRTVPDECAATFDAVVLGPALGVRKPDPEIFRRVAAILGLPVEQCVVVDDHAGKCRGARKAGAVVVHHCDVVTTIGEVEILLDLLPP